MTPRRRPQPFRVAIIGKGGSGKSVLAGTLARVLARRGHRVLALDSDAMPGLALSIGLGAIDRALLQDFAEQGPEGRWRIVRGLKPATVIRRAAIPGPDGVLFLQFGKMDSPSLGPVMSSLQAFWMVTKDLSQGPWTVIHDLPAGTRQPFAGWAASPDLFLLVVEPTQKSILSARRLVGVAETTPGSRLVVAVNKVARPDDAELVAGAIGSAPLVGVVPLDEAVVAAEKEGVAPIDRSPRSPAVVAVKELARELESLAMREGS